MFIRPVKQKLDSLSYQINKCNREQHFKCPIFFALYVAASQVLCNHSNRGRFRNAHYLVIAFDEGERKPNFVFASCVFRDGVPVYGYAEFFEIAVRTPKWRPRLSFAGACVGRETGANL